MKLVWIFRTFFYILLHDPIIESKNFLNKIQNSFHFCAVAKTSCKYSSDPLIKFCGFCKHNMLIDCPKHFFFKKAL